MPLLGHKIVIRYSKKKKKKTEKKVLKSFHSFLKRLLLSPKKVLHFFLVLKN